MGVEQIGTVERVQSGVDFTNMLQAAFASKNPKSTKGTDDLTVFLHFWNLCVCFEYTCW